MNLSRHRIDVKRAETQFREAIEKLPDYLQAACKNPVNLTLLISKSLEVAQCGSVATPGATDIFDSLRLASQGHAALFAVAASGGEIIEVLLGGETVQYKGTIDASTAYSQRWITGFFLSRICRDNESTKLLCQSLTTQLAQSSTREPEYRHLLVDALKAVWSGESDTGRHIIQALKATDPDRDDIRAPEWTLMIDVPLMQLLFYVWGHDKDFSEALVKAVLRHKEYWSKTRDRRQDWDGFLPIELLGLAAMAYDRQIPFHIDSEYLPQGLIQGRL
jgi:hypothetical protein